MNKDRVCWGFLFCSRCLHVRIVRFQTWRDIVSATIGDDSMRMYGCARKWRNVWERDVVMMDVVGACNCLVSDQRSATTDRWSVASGRPGKWSINLSRHCSLNVQPLLHAAGLNQCRQALLTEYDYKSTTRTLLFWFLISINQSVGAYLWRCCFCISYSRNLTLIARVNRALGLYWRRDPWLYYDWDAVKDVNSVYIQSLW